MLMLHPFLRVRVVSTLVSRPRHRTVLLHAAGHGWPVFLVHITCPSRKAERPSVVGQAPRRSSTQWDALTTVRPEPVDGTVDNWGGYAGG